MTQINYIKEKRFNKMKGSLHLMVEGGFFLQFPKQKFFYFAQFYKPFFKTLKNATFQSALIP